MQGAFPSEHCLTVPGIGYQQSRIMLLTSSSLGRSSEEAGTGSEVQGFLFRFPPWFSDVWLSRFLAA